MASLAKPIPESEWERHSETIHNLYHVRGLPLHSNKDEPNVLQIMRDHHQFDASISQYERHFRKRNRPKHLKKSEWRAVHATLNQLSAKKIAARVKLSGEVLSEERVKRSMRRAFVGPPQPASAIDTAILPTDRLTIETRGSNGEWTAYTGMSNTGDSVLGNNSVGTALEDSPGVSRTSIDPESLGHQNPGISHHQNIITQLGLVAPPSQVHSTSLQATIPAGPVEDDVLEPLLPLRRNIDLLENIGSSAAVHDTSFSSLFGNQLPFLSMEELSCPSFHNTMCTSLPQWHEDTGPFSQFQMAISSLRNQDNRYWHMPPSQNGTTNEDDPISRSVSQQSTEFAIISFVTSFEEQQTGELGISNDVELLDMHDVLDGLLSLVPQGLLSRGVSDEPTRSVALFESPVYHAIMFSLVNGFAGPENMPAGKFFGMVKTQTHMTSLLFDSLQSCRPALAKSLVDNLFRAAVEACDEQAVKFILQKAQRSSVPIDPNSIRCSMEDKYMLFTPIEVASRFGNIGIVKTLLNANADANKTYLPSYGKRRGALAHAIHKDNTYESINIELVQLLLDHNAEVTLEVVGLAIGMEMDDLLRRIISRLEPTQLSDCGKPGGHDLRICTQHLIVAATYSERELAALLFKKIFEHVHSKHNFGSSQSDMEVLEDLIYDAIMDKNIALAKFLLPYIPHKGLALSVAIRSGSNELIDLSILHGSTTGGPTYFTCQEISTHTGHIFEHIHSPRNGLTYPSSRKGRRLHQCTSFGDYEKYSRIDTINSSYPTTPFSEAIRSQDEGLIQRLLKMGALSHVCDEEHLKAMICAAAEVGNRDFLQLALKQVLLTRKQGEFLGQALNLAVLNDQFEVIEELLRAGDIYFKGSDCILLSSLLKKNYMVLDWLLESQCVRFGGSIQGLKVMKAAIQWGNTSIITDLLASETADPSNQQDLDNFLELAVESRNKSILKLFLDHDSLPPTHAQGYYFSNSLSVAISNRDEDIFRLLISSGADPANEGAFISAIKTDNQRVFNILLETFSKKYPQGRKGFGGTVLINSVQEERFTVIDRMIAVKFDVNTMECNYVFTPSEWKFPWRMKPASICSLGSAILLRKGKCLRLVQKLIHAGSDPNRIAWSGFGSPELLTPLLLAIRTRNTDMVELLLEKGADIHRPARRGIRHTPLQLACKMGSMKLVKLLLEKGATVHEPPAQISGATALQEAAMSGNTEIAKLLIANGADVYAPGAARKGGQTALEGAAMKGRMDMIKLLWDAARWQPFASAEVNEAIELAGKNGHRGCAEYLAELQQQTPSYPDLPQGSLFLAADLEEMV